MLNSASVARHDGVNTLSQDNQTTMSTSENTSTQWEEALTFVALQRDQHAYAELFSHFAPRLKALLDRVARAGITFKYTEQGPVGLLDDKPVVIFATRGGVYQGTTLDSQTPFLQTFFNFVGLKELHFVYAEGLNMGAEAQQSALAAAKQRLAEIGAAVAA